MRERLDTQKACNAGCPVASGQRCQGEFRPNCLFRQDQSKSVTMVFGYHSSCRYPQANGCTGTRQRDTIAFDVSMSAVGNEILAVALAEVIDEIRQRRQQGKLQ
jgi:hypothetical protein